MKKIGVLAWLLLLLALLSTPRQSLAASGSAIVPAGDLKYVALTFDDGPRSDTTSVLLDGLRQRGILVRWFDRPRISGHLRITVGTDEEMDALCAALEELTEERP